jgi:hypothetical protein
MQAGHIVIYFYGRLTEIQNKPLKRLTAQATLKKDRFIDE